MENKLLSEERSGGNPRTQQQFNQQLTDRASPRVKQELAEDDRVEDVQCSVETSKYCQDNAASSLIKVEPNIKQEHRTSTVICDLRREFNDNDVGHGVPEKPSTLVMKAVMNEVDVRGSQSLSTCSRSEGLMFPNEDKQNMEKSTNTNDVPQKALTSAVRPVIHTGQCPQTFAVAQDCMWPIKVKQEVEDEEECQIDVEDHVLSKYQLGLDEENGETGKSCKFTEPSKESDPASDVTVVVKVFVCSRCSFSTTQRGRYIRHMKRVHPHTLHKCSECDYVTKRKPNLNKHFKFKHDNTAEVLKCTACDYITKWNSSLSRHFKDKHDSSTEVLQCSECDYTSKSKINLHKHFRYMHDAGAEVFKCTQCGYATKRKSSLALHTNRRHGTDIKIYKCTVCDYTTEVRRQLMQHQEDRHGTAEVFKCGECDYTTKDKCNLKRHFRSLHDSNVAVLKCAECDYTTKSKFHLKEHFRCTHDSSAEVFRCTECGYTTKRKGNLTVHTKRMHRTDGKIYKCKICDYTTKIRTCLKQHKKETHNGEV